MHIILLGRVQETRIFDWQVLVGTAPEVAHFEVSVDGLFVADALVDHVQDVRLHCFSVLVLQGTDLLLKRLDLETLNSDWFNLHRAVVQGSLQRGVQSGGQQLFGRVSVSHAH